MSTSVSASIKNAANRNYLKTSSLCARSTRNLFCHQDHAISKYTRRQRGTHAYILCSPQYSPRISQSTTCWHPSLMLALTSRNATEHNYAYAMIHAVPTYNMYAYHIARDFRNEKDVLLGAAKRTQQWATI